MTDQALPTVLVVDDDPTIVRLLHRLLEEDFRVIDAADGLAALGTWQAEQPEAIVLDQMMPGMTGLAVAEQILSEDPLVPIVLFSAAADAEMMRLAARLGVRACVNKSEIGGLRDLLIPLVAAPT